MNTREEPTAAPSAPSTPRKLAVAAALTAVVLGTAWVLAPGVGAATSPQPAPVVRTLPAAGIVGVADLVERVQPAVVNISTRGVRQVSGVPPMPQFRFPPGSPFEEFFKRFGQPGEGPRSRGFEAQGSGFIVDPDGWVVTNNHVIDGAEEITVTLADGRQLDAELRGRDPKTDLAVLKIDPQEPLPHVRFGDSDAVRVGEQVVAIGNPFGLGGTVTTGIVSARGRNINSGPYDDFLQVDAAINRGNSGGPLFDLDGDVVGVNTAIFSPSGGNVGIGFAIPSSLARSVVDQLRADGRVERGWLGVQIQPVTEDIAESLGLPRTTRGALVAQVLPDSPALAAGVEVGDVITAFGDTSIEEVRDLTRAVAETRAQREVALKIWRAGAQRTLSVSVGRMPGDEQLADAAPDAEGETPDVRLGVALAPLDGESRSRFGLDESTSGALIVDVQRDSPAARQGLRPGDVIVRVGKTPVASPDDVAREVRQAAGDKRSSVLLLVERGGSQRFVAVSLDKA